MARKVTTSKKKIVPIRWGFQGEEEKGGLGKNRCHQEGRSEKDGDQEDCNVTKKTATKKKETKKAEKKPKTKRASRKKVVAEVRLKAFWGVFNQSLKRVALYEYNQRRQADKRAGELIEKSSSPHFVQLVKEVIEAD